MNDILDFIGALVLTLIVSFLLIVFIGILLSPLMIITCDKQWASFEHRWGFMEGCMIKVKGSWIPENNYREIK